MRESILVSKRQVESVILEDFTLKMIIGRGTFGKVYLAERMDKLYAIKAIRKDTLIEYNQV
jgi:serine/threonine protein kinase